MRRILLSLLIFVASVSPVLALSQENAKPMRILFVGNSLTYVGNLPAVLQGLSAENNKKIESDMIVKGGATLSERVTDGSVLHALQAQHYDYLILQERGGDALGAFGDQVSEEAEEAERALKTLASIAVVNKVQAISLGTYQPNPQMSKILLATEHKLAARASVDYVDVQTSFIAGKSEHQDLAWLHADKGHPGHDLILLESVLLFKQLFGVFPQVSELRINAPMYKPGSSFTLPAPTSLSLLTPDIALTHNYSAAELTIIINTAKSQVQ